jgi:hypothetical protein
MSAPPADNLIRDFVRRDISAAIQAFEITRKIEHQGLKGKAREIFVRNLFRSLLSNDFQFGSGVITDQFGKQAKETDVILYCPEVMPARDAGEAAGIFPIEACIYAIEVKSMLSATEITDAVEKGRALATLDCVFFNQLGPISSRPITALFAFSSDLRSDGDAEFERFYKIVDGAGKDRFGVPYVRVLCVVGKGYWYWIQDGWFRLGASGPLDEVVGLTAGLLNSVRSEKLRRYGLPFGHYLLTDTPVVRLK